MVNDPSARKNRAISKPAKRRKQVTKAKPQRGPLPAHEALLGKIQRQFERLEDELDGLEATMIRTGWMPDPVEERKAARAAAKAARLAAGELHADGELDADIQADDVDPPADALNEVHDDHRLPRKPR